MSSGGMRGARPARVNPNAPSAGAVLPTHIVPADPGDDTAAPNLRPVASRVVVLLWYVITTAVVLGIFLFGVWMDPVVSIDSVSATGLQVPDAAAAGKNASPSFDVAVRFKTRWFHLLPNLYTNGTVAVSCAGGAVTARGELQDVEVSAMSPSVVSATVRAPPTALPGDARDRLAGELRRGEVHLQVSVAYETADSVLGDGFRALVLRDVARTREFNGDGVVRRVVKQQPALLLDAADYTVIVW